MALNPPPSRCRGLRRGAFGLRCPPMLQPLQSDDRDAAALAIGIDTGGTFTDVLALDPGGGLRAAKLPSTPADPAQAVITGVALLRGDAASAAPGAPLTITHGTTVATNTLLERRGGPTALLVTAGFTDVLRLGRQARAALYALNPVQPPPLCPPELCIPVEERLGPDGAVLTPLRPETLAALREQVAALNVASVAVVLLPTRARAQADIPFLTTLVAQSASQLTQLSQTLTTLRQTYEETRRYVGIADDAIRTFEGMGKRGALLEALYWLLLSQRSSIASAV